MAEEREGAGRPMGEEPRVTIIIVNWNTRDLLANCLDSIYAYPPDCSFEVIVVDNGSSDGSVDVVRQQFPQVRLVENEQNVGFAAANNQGIALSRGEYLLLLNSDCEARPGSLDRFCQHAQVAPERCGGAGAKLTNPDGTFQASYARFPTLWAEMQLMTGLARLTIGPHAPSPEPQPGEQARPVDWVAGAALLVSRKAIEQVGGLDEAFFMYSEEADWCWRLSQAGWNTWYLPDAILMHHGGASTRLRRQASYVQLYLSKLEFARKAHGSRSRSALAALLGALAAVRSACWRLLSLVPATSGDGLSARRRAVADEALAHALLAAVGREAPAVTR